VSARPTQHIDPLKSPPCPLLPVPTFAHTPEETKAYIHCPAERDLTSSSSSVTFSPHPFLPFSSASPLCCRKAATLLVPSHATSRRTDDASPTTRSARQTGDRLSHEGAHRTTTGPEWKLFPPLLPPHILSGRRVEDRPHPRATQQNPRGRKRRHTKATNLQVLSSVTVTTVSSGDVARTPLTERPTHLYYLLHYCRCRHAPLSAFSSLSQKKGIV